jgi:hypothetical protein
MNWGFVIIGAIIGLIGLGLLVTGIRNRGKGEDPRATAMLIGGTMATAFGIVLAGFAIAYAASAPLEEEAQ